MGAPRAASIVKRLLKVMLINFVPPVTLEDKFKGKFWILSMMY